VDPHVHLIPGGLFLSKVNLRELRGGRQEFAQRLAAAAASDSSSSSSSGGGDAGLLRWLLGIGWSESDWGGQLPDRNWIDEVGSHAQPPGGGGGQCGPREGGGLLFRLESTGEPRGAGVKFTMMLVYCHQKTGGSTPASWWHPSFCGLACDGVGSTEEASCPTNADDSGGVDQSGGREGGEHRYKVVSVGSGGVRLLHHAFMVTIDAACSFDITAGCYPGMR
jgi:hypothetical protein